MRQILKPVHVVTLASMLAIPAMAAGAATPPEPHETVAAFHEALSLGDKATVLDLLATEVTIFESGGAELSRDEYADHHLGADMEFAAATSRKVIDRQSDSASDTAWVLTRSETRGTFRGREIDSLGVETMLLEKGEGGWRIFHIHWSSRDKPAPR